MTKNKGNIVGNHMPVGRGRIRPSRSTNRWCSELARRASAVPSPQGRGLGGGGRRLDKMVAGKFRAAPESVSGAGGVSLSREGERPREPHLLEMFGLAGTL